MDQQSIEHNNNLSPQGDGCSSNCKAELCASERNDINTNGSNNLLDNIIVGYAFGPKKMETMGLIMAEASKAQLCSSSIGTFIDNKQTNNNNDLYDRLLELSQLDETETASMTTMTSTNVGTLEEEEDTRSLSSTYTRSSYLSSSQKSHSIRSGGGNFNNNNNNSNNENHGIQLTFLPDYSNGYIHLIRPTSSSSSFGGIETGGGLHGGGERGREGGDSSSFVGSAVTTTSSSLSTVTATTTTSSVASSSKQQESILTSTSSSPMSSNKEIMVHHHESSSTLLSKSIKTLGEPSNSSGISRHHQQHPIRVSFVPIDLDTPLSEQHGGKFDVILHKLTEDILCLSKMLRRKGEGDGEAGLHNMQQEGSNDEYDWNNDTMYDENALSNIGGHQEEPNTLLESSSTTTIIQSSQMTRNQLRASKRIQRLREYKQTVHPSCVLVDSPSNILAVMSRADMATVLSRCLAGVTTKGGLPVRTPRFRVVDDSISYEEEHIDESRNLAEKKECLGGGNVELHSCLADEIDKSGFEYPIIAKPLTAAGTKSSHHMGIVLARDGLQRLKTPCLLQEYANHGEKLFKVYVLGDSVWVFSRDSLPNLPGREVFESQMQTEEECGGRPYKRSRTESYVEFERPAGSRCYVEFNSQRPYPKLSDFGLGLAKYNDPIEPSCFIKQQQGVGASDQRGVHPQRKRQHSDSLFSNETISTKNDSSISTIPSSDLARFVSRDELEPVTAALRNAFGLELFGFDVLVKHNSNSTSQKDKNSQTSRTDDRDSNNSKNFNNDKEILVVDVNYFPGYKEVPNFPSLLAQYLTQKAVESRVRNYCGSDYR
jgi:hypothetical protein